MISESPSIPTLVPAGVAAAEWTDGYPSSGPAPESLPPELTLFPEEEAMLGEVGAKRRWDFIRGRHCGRHALQQLGLESMPILRGPVGQPLWPPGICGSITHCAGYSAAAAAHRSDVSSLGIDAECRRPLTEGVLNHISLEAERSWIRGADPCIPWDILLFSAKESVYKAWFPIAGTRLGFKHARIQFQPEAQGFRALLLPPAPAIESHELDGKFYVDATRVITCVIIPAKPQRSRPWESGSRVATGSRRFSASLAKHAGLVPGRLPE